MLSTLSGEAHGGVYMRERARFRWSSARRRDIEAALDDADNKPGPVLAGAHQWRSGPLLVKSEKSVHGEVCSVSCGGVSARVWAVALECDAARWTRDG